MLNKDILKMLNKYGVKFIDLRLQIVKVNINQYNNTITPN